MYENENIPLAVQRLAPSTAAALNDGEFSEILTKNIETLCVLARTLLLDPLAEEGRESRIITGNPFDGLDVSQKQQLARYPQLGDSALRLLAGDSSPLVRLVVAGRTGLHLDMIEQLRSDVDEIVRLTISERGKRAPTSWSINPILDIAPDEWGLEGGVRSELTAVLDVVEMFLGSSNARQLSNERQIPQLDALDVLQILHLLKEPDLKLFVLEYFVNHSDPIVRVACAAHPKIYRSCSEQLAKDEERMVRLAVARNPHSHHEALELLAIEGQRKEDTELLEALSMNPTARAFNVIPADTDNT